jgi:hypothetical protein
VTSSADPERPSRSTRSDVDSESYARLTVAILICLTDLVLATGAPVSADWTGRDRRTWAVLLCVAGKLLDRADLRAEVQHLPMNVLPS